MPGWGGGGAIEAEVTAPGEEVTEATPPGGNPGVAPGVDRSVTQVGSVGRVGRAADGHGGDLVRPAPAGVALDDGRSVALRPVQPDDVERLRRLFFRLSPATVHLRFFQPVKSPSDAALQHLAEVDHDRRQAIAALDGEEIVGVARYDRSADPARAEVAVVVEDGWQAHGIGTLLLTRIAAEAHEHGIETLTASVLGENRRTLALAYRLAPAAKARVDHGEFLLEIPIGGRSCRMAQT
ncbi:MAG: GNAT family N-acetyltransferase [Acidimicrobiales bacterium]